MAFARREGAGGIEVLNLFALRATNPTEVRRVPDPFGPDNDEWIRGVLFPHSRVVAAWGQHGKYLGRGFAVFHTLRESGINVVCLGEKPKPPLYIRGDQPLLPLLAYA